MAISFVGSHVGTHAAITAQTVTFASVLRDESNNLVTSLNQGDIVYVAVENASTVNRTQAQLTPSGYTAVHTNDYRNDSNDSNFQVSRKVMGSTPDITVAIPASNATTAGVGYAIYVFRGVDNTTPEDVTTVVTGAINTGIANAAAITPTTAGAWVAVFGGAAVAAGAVFTNPSGMSATTNHFRSATITSTTNDANIGGALYTGWTSGSYDPAVFGGSTSTNTGSWSAVTIALRPYVAPTLTVQEAGHGHAADNIDLTSQHDLIVQEAAHAHAADNVVLDASIPTALTIQEAAHAHAAEAPTLQLDSFLAVQDASHAHSAGQPVLSALSYLEVQEASHTHTADNLNLTSEHAIIVQDASHAHAVENVVLSTGAAPTELVIADAAHAHAVDSLGLTTASQLALADASHAHTADALDLSVDGGDVEPGFETAPQYPQGGAGVVDPVKRWRLKIPERTKQAPITINATAPIVFASFIESAHAQTPRPVYLIKSSTTRRLRPAELIRSRKT